MQSLRGSRGRMTNNLLKLYYLITKITLAKQTSEISMYGGPLPASMRSAGSVQSDTPFYRRRKNSEL